MNEACFMTKLMSENSNMTSEIGKN